jgi:hypothetical protein
MTIIKVEKNDKTYMRIGGQYADRDGFHCSYLDRLTMLTADRMTMLTAYRMANLTADRMTKLTAG